ncbi:uncharacterized protein TNCV_3764621 [Trichonephila clavipes]|uniref:Uncharacterized protein n=1 Tax=Trichonephila clavipes TaxID=2585209 RepID=A0A8X7B8K0_TRICX|nr:uncharacterized protein TNCV_3764621 [Trichonephila clavipes]
MDATCHRTLAVQVCIDSEGIQHLVRPARSPDLNPIEMDALGEASCWSKLSSDKQEHPHPCTPAQEWDKVPQQLLDNVVQRDIRRSYHRISRINNTGSSIYMGPECVVTPCLKGTIHLQTSISSPGFEPSPYGTAVSTANHCTGWATRKFESSIPITTTSTFRLSVRSRPTSVAAVAEWYRYRTVACFVTGSSPVPLKTRRVGQRCTLNLSRAETSSRWCGVVVRRGGCQLRCRPRHLTMVQNYVVRRQKPSCS